MAETMRSRRCFRCDINWPQSDRWQTCPRCEIETEHSWMLPSLDWNAAVRITQAWIDWRRYEADERAAADRAIAQLDEQFQEVPHA